MLNIREQKQTKGYPKRIPLFLLVGKTIQCYTEHEFDAKSAETKSEAKSEAKLETKTKKSTGMSELGEELQRKFETEER